MIHGQLVTLRAPERRDAAILNSWANDPDLWRNLGGWHFPYSEASTLAWIEARNGKAAATDQVYCIDVPGIGIVGTASLSRIDWKNRTAEHGIMIGTEAHRGKGYAKDATLALMHFAFEELGLERLDAEIIASNVRSQRFFSKCGWTLEGVRKGWYFRNGERVDQMLYGIQRAEFSSSHVHARPHRRPGARPHHVTERHTSPVVEFVVRRPEGPA